MPPPLPSQLLFEPLPRAKYATDPQSDSVTRFIGSPAIGKVPDSAWVLSKYLLNQLNSPGANSGRRRRTQPAELDPSPFLWASLSPQDPTLGGHTGSMKRVYMGWAEGCRQKGNLWFSAQEAIPQGRKSEGREIKPGDILSPPSTRSSRHGHQSGKNLLS